MAIFLTQDFLPAKLAAVFRTIVELLAAIPAWCMACGASTW
jgi:phosphate transport system permease protein